MEPDKPNEAVTGRAKGGIARAESLSAEKRKQIARNAALARWDGKLPRAEYEGEFQIGDSMISCAVLEDGRRIITQSAFLRAMGRARSPKAGTGVLSTVDRLPFFLQADALRPFISEELMRSTEPLFYLSKDGGKGVGYDAQLLPKTCETYLKLRDASLAEFGKVPKRYEHIIRACDTVIRSLAGVAIVALVDEATGYQYVRARDALAKILEAFIAKELRPWVRTFPNEFYDHLFRLRGLQFPRDSVKRPQYFGHLTNNIIYARLAPGVLEELKRMTPRNDAGRLKHHMHRRLTEDMGHPRLREHLASVISLMKISETYPQFESYLTKAHPKYNETMSFDFMHEDNEAGL
jgi:hypothetical protein